MPKQNDNRMAWIRNIEALSKSGGDSYKVEFEFASECRFAGVLDYESGKIACGPLTVERDKNGLYHYLLRITFSRSGLRHNPQADPKGYYFKDGIAGELLSLFALYFQCRFFLIATYTGELTNTGMKVKLEYDFPYKPCIPAIHPTIFLDDSQNFAAGLSDFLDKVRGLAEEKHQGFILACYHYARALKEVGIDSEMVFIRLVSAVERLSKDHVLTKQDNPLNDESFTDLFGACSLTPRHSQHLREILQVSKAGKIQIEKSKKKFISFICKYSKGCLKGGAWKAKHLKITREALPKALKAIYDARSSYLHNGEPMYLSEFVHGSAKWDTDPSLGMIADNRSFTASQKLPYTYWFENLVRCCLINYLNS